MNNSKSYFIGHITYPNAVSSSQIMGYLMNEFSEQLV